MTSGFSYTAVTMAFLIAVGVKEVVSLLPVALANWDIEFHTLLLSSGFPLGTRKKASPDTPSL